MELGKLIDEWEKLNWIPISHHTQKLSQSGLQISGKNQIHKIYWGNQRHNALGYGSLRNLSDLFPMAKKQKNKNKWDCVTLKVICMAKEMWVKVKGHRAFPYFLEPGVPRCTKKGYQ